MEDSTHKHLGGRLPLREPTEIVGAQRAMYESMVKEYSSWAEKAGFEMLTSEGQLIGPFNAFLLNPEITKALLAFDTALKEQASFSDRVREVIILAVGGVWDSKYELYAHSIMGRNAGLSDEAIVCLKSGKEPRDLTAEETLAARIAQGMAKTFRISDSLFDDGVKMFGHKALYEIATLIGEFSVTCAILNLFDIPAPTPQA